MDTITFHALNEHSRFPEKAHPSDAGWDVFFTGINHSDLIPAEHEFLILKPHQLAVLGTGICATIPIGSEIQVRSRSGWASKGLIVTNGIGTIDANYRGEIRVILCNVGNSDIQIAKGSKIAQLVPCKLDKFRIINTNESIDQNTDRGVSGFGDSDKK